MASLKLTLQDLILPLKHPFTTAHGTIETQHNLLVALEYDGLIGYGESPSSRSWPLDDAAAVRKTLEEVRPVIESLSFSDPEFFWEQMQGPLQNHSFALCALDQAAHDLKGKMEGKAVWERWGLSLDALPLTDYTIGIDTIDQMVAKMREFPDWPVYKIKLGTADDLSLVRGLRQHTQAKFRIDANTGWTVNQTLELAPLLRDLGVEWIEQPLPIADWEGMKALKGKCALPLIADESIRGEADVDRCAEAFDGINIKLCKAGGLTPARKIIQKARERGLSVMVGCMCESSIGISAIAQLLPLLDDADLDGALLLAEDIADGVRFEAGKAIFPQRPGTGAVLKAR